MEPRAPCYASIGKSCYWLVFPDSLLASSQDLGTALPWAVAGLGVTTDAGFIHQRLSGTDSHHSDDKGIFRVCQFLILFCFPLKDAQ